jgi:bifunctional UDP-N-acetylglucosamine pyrophosphorylase/glucosamine-1-phosphate N-acetyltransferase
MNHRIFAVILAGGRGTRMNSPFPKFLHCIKNKSMIEYVIDACLNIIEIEKIYIIVPSLNFDFLQKLSHKIEFIVQEEPLGTGHAIQILIEKKYHFFDTSDQFLILNADMPNIQTFLLEKFLHHCQTIKCESGLIGAYLENPKGYGRLIIDKETSKLQNIEEDKDCKDRSINLCNIGIYFFTFSVLEKNINYLTNVNKAHEYYLTQLFDFMKDTFVSIITPQEIKYILGVNTQEELQYLSSLL